MSSGTLSFVGVGLRPYSLITHIIRFAHFNESFEAFIYGLIVLPKPVIGNPISGHSVVNSGSRMTRLTLIKLRGNLNSPTPASEPDLFYSPPVSCADIPPSGGELGFAQLARPLQDSLSVLLANLGCLWWVVRPGQEKFFYQKGVFS